MRISAQCTSSVSQTRIKVGVYKNDTSVIFLWVGFHICNLAWAAPSMYHPFLILYKATTAYRVMEPELGVVSSRPLCSQLCELSYKDCPTPLMTRIDWIQEPCELYCKTSHFYCFLFLYMAGVTQLSTRTHHNPRGSLSLCLLEPTHTINILL